MPLLAPEQSTTDRGCTPILFSQMRPARAPWTFILACGKSQEPDHTSAINWARRSAKAGSAAKGEQVSGVCLFNSRAKAKACYPPAADAIASAKWAGVTPGDWMPSAW